MRSRLVWCCLVVTGLAQGRDAADWVRDLGAPQNEVREAAERQLVSQGLAARQAVRSVLKDPDPEVRLRAQRIWQQVRWGLEPEPTQALLVLLADWRQGKSRGVPGFAETWGAQTLRAIPELRTEPDEAAQKLAGAIAQRICQRFKAVDIAAQLQAMPGEIPLASLASDSLTAEGYRTLVQVGNLLWQADAATALGLRAWRRWPEDRELRQPTLLAIRASGCAEAIWERLGKPVPERADFLLLAYLAEDTGTIPRFAELVAQGVPEGLAPDELTALADLLEQEDQLPAAKLLLERGDTAMLHYRLSRLLLCQDDPAGAAREWELALTKLADPGAIYTLASRLEQDGDSRAEIVWRKLLREDGKTDVYASNACFRLAAIHEARADYAVAADFYQRGLDCMEGAILMTVGGKSLTHEQAKERIAETIRTLRAQAATPP